VCLYLCDCLHPASGCHNKCYVVIGRAVVVNLHISATLAAVLPVKFIYTRGLLHAKLKSITSYRYLTPFSQHRIAGRPGPDSQKFLSQT